MENSNITNSVRDDTKDFQMEQIFSGGCTSRTQMLFTHYN